MPSSASLYVAIDLGSNSFHMLVVREMAGGIQTLSRIKRKVRLAAGLNRSQTLSLDAMERGWHCLRLFAERLPDIPAAHIRIVATATLRMAVNSADFIGQAEAILGHPIEIIQGEEEARLIYQGVAHTTGGEAQRLVVDIGGASTELITGTGTQATALFSLPMGCVTWLERFFSDRNITQASFDAAQAAACEILLPVISELQHHGWKVCVGASGIVQALQQIMLSQGMDESITLSKLTYLKQRTIECGHLDELEIEGLTLERALVFPSGLAILIAIFEQLAIDDMTLAGGALREGLVYSMLTISNTQGIGSRTLSNIQQRFAVDVHQADRVQQLALAFAASLENTWQLDSLSIEMLTSAALLHEIGLSIDFRQAPSHAAYLVENLSLPGFTSAQKTLLAALLLNQTNPINLVALHQQNAVAPGVAEKLCRLLRLAIIVASRSDDILPNIRLTAEEEVLHLVLPESWLACHPLAAELLEQERLWQSYVHWTLIIY